MSRLILPIILVLFALNVQSQNFSFDNVNFSTISWDDFFKRLDSSPNLIFFDIRTPGERADTSQFSSYNQGKIKGAKETDYSDFDRYYPEYKKYKSDTIYLYCSHSRRSRRLAKRLSDSLFTHVVSINGGLSFLNTMNKLYRESKSKHFTTSLSYQQLTPYEFKKVLKSKDSQIIDVRPDSIFFGTATIEWQNTLGNIKNAIHIPFDRIHDHYHLLDKSKRIILFDNFNEHAAGVADSLIKKGYNAAVLLFGLDNVTTYLSSKERKFLKTKYKLITPSELLINSKEKNNIIIDIRTVTEFNSNDSIDWKNVGRINNAINIPLSELTREKIEGYKTKRIILYDNMMHDELYDYAKKMMEFGFKNFELLVGGISQVKWEIHNAAKEELKVLIEENKM